METTSVASERSESEVQSCTSGVEEPEALTAAATRQEGNCGCDHYRRRCKLVAPCCGDVFWCRHCHNEVKCQDEIDPKKRHELDRKTVKELVCGLCNIRQPCSPTCQECGVNFGKYTCMDCIFFDDDTSKNQFHCSDCGICRVGGRDKFFHCQKCGCCYSTSLKDNHVCVENSMKQNCPVCFEFLFDSVQPTSVLNCGHTIHQGCLEDMQRNRQLSCPICMKSYANLESLWQTIDDEVAVTPMPDVYRNWKVAILCNDCNRPSQVLFHVLGLKCSHCRSYNTRRVGSESCVNSNGRVVVPTADQIPGNQTHPADADGDETD